MRRILIGVAVATLAAGVIAAPNTAVADPTPPLGTTVESPAPGGAYVPVTPTRVLDTRSGLGGTRGASEGTQAPVLGRAGIPTTGVIAVVVTVTVVDPAAAGFVNVGNTSTSVGNFRAHQTVAQLATSRPAVDGTLSVYTSVVAHQLLDVVGYFTDTATVATGATFHPVTARLLDTRTAGSGGPTTSGTARRVVARGAPAGSTAVAVNVTVVRPAASVYATVWASGTRPVASVVNAVANEVRSTRAIVPLAADGSFQVAVVGGRSDLVVDVSGWFAGSDGGYFQPTPGRLVDTRSASQAEAPYPYAYAVASSLQAVGRPPLNDTPATPDPDALARPMAAWLTLTVLSDRRSGWTAVTGTRGDPRTPQPAPATATSDVNWGPGVTANAALPALGDGGWVSLYGKQFLPPGRSAPQANVVVDLSGVFVLAPPAAAPGLWKQGGPPFSGTQLRSLHRVPVATGAITGAAVSADGNTGIVFADGTVMSSRQDTAPLTRLDAGAVQVVGGERGLFVRKRDGTVWTNDWAAGSAGVPGQSLTYRQVVGVAGAVDIAADAGRPVAVLVDGTVVTWGGSTAPQVTSVPLAGPVRDVAAFETGLACVAYADGSVDTVQRDGSRRHVDGVDAVEVAAVLPASQTGSCFARDSQNRLHAIGTSGTDRIVPGGHAVTAMSAVSTEVGRGLDIGRPVLRIIDDAGRVLDLDPGYLWVHQAGLDGATAVGGGRFNQIVAVA